MGDVLLEIKGIKKYFRVEKGFLFFKKTGWIKAVDGVDLAVRRGESIGLVGESGCGKTTVGRVILKSVEPTAGRLTYDSKDYTRFNRKEMLPLRREMQLIFQDPYSSLDPRMPVGVAIGEPLIAHGFERNRSRVRTKVLDLLQVVGLSSDFYHRYPHEMSGGQRQRVAVARVLVMNPKLIIADEPVSALDVSIQAQILNLLRELQEKFFLTYLFITHDLTVARYVSSRIAVMYLGKVVEISTAEELFREPVHPYSKALLSSIPSLEPHSQKTRIVLAGDVPSPLNLPTGCRFHPRCPEKQDICAANEPILREIGEDHQVVCHRCT